MRAQILLVATLLLLCQACWPSAAGALPNSRCANVVVTPDLDKLSARPGETITLTYKNEPLPGCNARILYRVSDALKSSGIKSVESEGISDLENRVRVTLKEQTWKRESYSLYSDFWFMSITGNWAPWSLGRLPNAYIDVKDWEGNDFAITSLTTDVEPDYDGNKLNMRFESDNLDPRNITHKVDWSISFQGPVASGSETGTCRLSSSNQTCSGYFGEAVAEPGRYDIEACINIAGPNQVPDGDESNNCRTMSVTAPDPLPELTVGFALDPPPATVDEETTATIRVSSQSRAFTAPVDTEIELRTPSGEAVRVPVLQLVDSRDVEVPWTPQVAGQGILRVEVDPDNLIAEVVENNNDASRTVVVDEAIVQLPDLYFQPHDLTFSPPDPRPGELITFTVRLQNRGPVEAPANARIRFEHRGQTQSLVCGAPLPPYGGSCERTFSATAAVGLHTATVTADPMNEIPEVFETNNQRSLNYAVSDGSGSVTCQGTWHLEGVDHAFSSSGPGSVVDNCHVYWGQNAPSDPNICWETTGADLWTAVWLDADADGCPDYATATDGGATYEYTVTIAP